MAGHRFASQAMDWRGRVLLAALAWSALGMSAGEASAAEPANGPPTGADAPAPGRSPPGAAAGQEELAQAKTMFRAANEARRGGALREAIRLYAQSRAIVPSVPNTLNAALCHADLGELDRALELYEELREKFGSELDAVRSASLEERIATLRAAVVRIELGAALSGSLLVDGVERASLPARGHVYVMPGPRLLRLLSPGQATLRLAVERAAGESARFDAVTAKPEPRTSAPEGPLVGRSDGAGGAGVGPTQGSEGPRADGPPESGPVGFWLSPSVGLLVASGVGSGAAANCSEACEAAGPALGWTVGLTAGYELLAPLSLELGIHYGALAEERTRIVRASFVDTASGHSLPTSYTIRDQISLAGPVVVAGLGARWRSLAPLELGAHTLVGVGYFYASDDVEAAASAAGRTLTASLEGVGDEASGLDLVVLETVDVGLELAPVTIRIGLTAMFGLLPGPSYETGDLVVVGGTCERPGSDTIDCAPGSGAARAERAWGPFVIWSPFAAARFEF